MNLEGAEQSSVKVPLPWPLCPEPQSWPLQLYTNYRSPIQAQGLKIRASKQALSVDALGTEGNLTAVLWVFSYYT